MRTALKRQMITWQSSPQDSPQMDRNPSPPPDREHETGEEEDDAIGDTVYSKHWLFSTLTRLIQVFTELPGSTDNTLVDLIAELFMSMCFFSCRWCLNRTRKKERVWQNYLMSSRKSCVKSGIWPWIRYMLSQVTVCVYIQYLICESFF